MNLYHGERRRSDGTLVCTLWTCARHETNAIDYLVGDHVSPAFIAERRLVYGCNVLTIRDKTKTSDYWVITTIVEDWCKDNIERS